MVSELYKKVIAEVREMKPRPYVPQYMGKYRGKPLFYEASTERYFHKVSGHFKLVYDGGN